MSRTPDYHYIIRHVAECFRVQAYAFDTDLGLTCPETLPAPEKIYFLKTILANCTADKADSDFVLLPQVLILADNVYFAFFPNVGEAYLLLGPMGSNYLTTGQAEAFWEKYNLAPEKKRIPKFSVQQIMSMTALVWLMLTGESMDTSQISIRKNDSFQLTVSDSTSYHLYKHKEEKKQHTYEGEWLWFRHIENGDVRTMNEKIAKVQNIASEFDHVGTQARDNEYKQLEYNLVTFVSLAAHAAIRGGVPPLNCYEASDLLLQKAAACHDILRLYDLFIECFRTFTTLVHLRRQEPRRGVLIEQCKNYIARHLYQPFKISDMAAELNISNNYLSQLFSKKTGMTIQQYIRDERLNAAANLLKYSDEPVGQISDYMRFSSPSRFSLYFKEKYHMTPSEYREYYKIIEFKE